MLYYLENGSVLYLVGAVLLIGLLSKWIANRTYHSLLRQTERFQNVKNKALKQLQNQYESIYKSHGELHNVPVFIEKQLGQVKVAGVRLYRMENMALPAALLCFLFGAASSLTVFLYHGTAELIVIQFAAGLLAGIVLLVSECFWDIESKRSLLFVQIQDYLENTMYIQLHTGATVAEQPVKKMMQDDIFMKTKPNQMERVKTVPVDAEYTDRRKNRRAGIGNAGADAPQTKWEKPQAEWKETGADIPQTKWAKPQAEWKDAGANHPQTGTARQNAEWKEEGSESRFDRGVREAKTGERENEFDRTLAHAETSGQERDKSIAFLRKSLEQIAAAKEQKDNGRSAWNVPTLSPQDEQLMEEIINEYLKKN